MQPGGWGVSVEGRRCEIVALTEGTVECSEHGPGA